MKRALYQLVVRLKRSQPLVPVNFEEALIRAVTLAVQLARLRRQPVKCGLFLNRAHFRAVAEDLG